MSLRLIPLLLLALAAPLVADDYWFNAILIPFFTLALAGLGLNILTGFAGQLSLGSAAFMAVGAFALARLSAVSAEAVEGAAETDTRVGSTTFSLGSL